MTTGEQKRVCGDCRACCTALIVDEVPKKEWERCKHLGSLGCKVYSKRPGSCATYTCGWLAGMGGRELRPDRIGVVFSLVSSEKLGRHALVHEVAAGALAKPEVRSIVEALTQETIVFHIQRDSMRRLLGGPAEQLRALLEQAQAAGVLSIDGETPAPDVPLDQLLEQAHARRLA